MTNKERIELLKAEIVLAKKMNEEDNGLTYSKSWMAIVESTIEMLENLEKTTDNSKEPSVNYEWEAMYPVTILEKDSFSPISLKKGIKCNINRYIGLADSNKVEIITDDRSAVQLDVDLFNSVFTWI